MSGALSAATPIAAGWRDYLELSKARIVLMVLITTAAGFIAGSPRSVNLVLLLHTLIGTAFVAGGTNALNQYVERHLDALMARTRRRPLPAGRMTERTALGFSIFISVFGVVYLAAVVNILASALALITLVTYLFLYTPLKRKTELCTLIGAGPGAIPPLVGWAAASGGITAGGWILFAILFLWQLPHFFAIGWIYREDYARAGFVMLSTRDQDGSATARQAVGYSVLLLLVSLLGPWGGLGGTVYLLGALTSGLLLLSAAWRFGRLRRVQDARRLFMTSNLYLMIIMLLAVTGSLT